MLLFFQRCYSWISRSWQLKITFTPDLQNIELCYFLKAPIKSCILSFLYLPHDFKIKQLSAIPYSKPRCYWSNINCFVNFIVRLAYIIFLIIPHHLYWYLQLYTLSTGKFFWLLQFILIRKYLLSKILNSSIFMKFHYKIFYNN